MSDNMLQCSLGAYYLFIQVAQIQSSFKLEVVNQMVVGLNNTVIINVMLKEQYIVLTAF